VRNLEPGEDHVGVGGSLFDAPRGSPKDYCQEKVESSPPQEQKVRVMKGYQRDTSDEGEPLEHRRKGEEKTLIHYLEGRNCENDVKN